MEPREHSEEILNLRASGMSLEGIAKKLHVGVKYVNRALGEARLRNDPRALRTVAKPKTADLILPLAKAGLTRHEIAARLGLSYNRVSAVAIEAGMKLADYISEKQTTASRLAGEVGVPVSTITRLLRGERRPGIELVARITAATNGAVSAEDFFPAPQPTTEQGAA